MLKFSFAVTLKINVRSNILNRDIPNVSLKWDTLGDYANHAIWKETLLKPELASARSVEKNGRIGLISL